MRSNRLLAATTLMIPLCFAQVAQAENPQHVQQLLETKQCSGCDLRFANLSNANLEGANLKGADLRGANLANTNLSRSTLNSANLGAANLVGANLRAANLMSADFSYANLASADLRNALFSNASLSGANLAGTMGLPLPVSPLDDTPASAETPPPMPTLQPEGTTPRPTGGTRGGFTPGNSGTPSRTKGGGSHFRQDAPEPRLR